MNEAQIADRVEVVIRGPGHHERAARAEPVIAAIAALGFQLTVSTDLRPRLADDIRLLLDAGASRVRLEAEGIVGDLAESADPLPDGSILVVLRPGLHAEPEVSGDGPVAAAVREALGAVQLADGGGG